MSEGDSLRKICRDNGMAEATVRQWVRDDRLGALERFTTALTQVRRE
jgi:transposase-like protein